MSTPTIELLRDTLSKCDGVELLTQGENVPGAVRRGAVCNSPHKWREGDPDVLFWNERHSTEVLVHSWEPAPYEAEVKQLVAGMRGYLKTLGRHPEESAPIATPDEARNVVDFFPIKLDGFHVRVLQSYVHTRQGIVITMDSLFPEKASA